jgi:uncharacterized membrane protein HdeD (DUF308 family)
MLWGGIAMLVLGIAALVFPMVFTVVTTFMVGWALLLFGVVTLLGSFSIHGTGPFFGALLAAILALAAGVFLLANPLAGAAALTLIVAGVFSLQGAFEISFAFEMRPHKGWVMMLISGIISVIAAVWIVAAWPGISLVLLGILFGINFASTGLASIYLSRALRRAA